MADEVNWAALIVTNDNIIEMCRKLHATCYKSISWQYPRYTLFSSLDKLSGADQRDGSALWSSLT